MIDIEKLKRGALDGDLLAVEALITRLEAAERDADRYRWLRTNPDWETYELGTPIVFVTCDEEAIPAQGGELDIAVDAAMQEPK